MTTLNHLSGDMVVGLLEGEYDDKASHHNSSENPGSKGNEKKEKMDKFEVRKGNEPFGIVMVLGF